jgi:hypothetical protein
MDFINTTDEIVLKNVRLTRILQFYQGLDARYVMVCLLAVLESVLYDVPIICSFCCMRMCATMRCHTHFPNVNWTAWQKT